MCKILGKCLSQREFKVQSGTDTVEILVCLKPYLTVVSEQG